MGPSSSGTSSGGGWGSGATVLSTALSVAGGLGQAKATERSFQYKAGMAQLNKNLALQTADYTRKMGEVQAGESGLRSRFQQGKILSGQGASGIDVNTGSAVGVRTSQTQIAQMDEGIIRANAARRAYGYDVEAAKDESEAQMDLRAASDTKRASYFTAATSILGGASSVADKWSQASQYGLYSNPGPTFSGDGSQSSMGGGEGGGTFG